MGTWPSWGHGDTLRGLGRGWGVSLPSTLVPPPSCSSVSDWLLPGEGVASLAPSTWAVHPEKRGGEGEGRSEQAPPPAPHHRHPPPAPNSILPPAPQYWHLSAPITSTPMLASISSTPIPASTSTHHQHSNTSIHQHPSPAPQYWHPSAPHQYPATNTCQSPPQSWGAYRREERVHPHPWAPRASPQQ